MSEIPSPLVRRMAMHLLRAVPVLALLVVVFLPGASLAGAPPDGDAPGAAASQTTIFGVTRESGGAVMVDLTPKEFSNGELSVAIGVNTHTVNDLDKYDLTRLVTLKADELEVTPVSAPRLRGHHNRGELVFPLKRMPASLTIEIRGLDDPDVRTFNWP